MSAIGKTPVISGGDLVAAGTLNPQGSGLFTLTINNLTKEVLSVQPDGSWQVRPAGTAGPYELAAVNNGILVYCPDGQHIYAFPFFASCPNV